MAHTQSTSPFYWLSDESPLIRLYRAGRPAAFDTRWIASHIAQLQQLENGKWSLCSMRFYYVTSSRTAVWGGSIRYNIHLPVDNALCWAERLYEPRLFGELCCVYLAYQVQHLFQKQCTRDKARYHTYRLCFPCVVRRCVSNTTAEQGGGGGGITWYYRAKCTSSWQRGFVITHTHEWDSSHWMFPSLLVKHMLCEFLLHRVAMVSLLFSIWNTSMAGGRTGWMEVIHTRRWNK